MKELLDRLDTWLAKHRYRFHKNLGKAAPPAALSKLDKSLGQPAPEGLRQLLAWHNGQGDNYVGYFQDHWLLMSAEKIAAAKAELDASGAKTWKKTWLPFLDDDGGNFLCLDLSKKEPPVMAYWGEDAVPEKVAPSLEAWLKEFVAAVEAGEYYEDPERGTFQRGKKK